MTGSERDEGSLHRVVGLGGATFLGLGSILGTGVFVSIGLAAGVAGPSVILAVIAAAAIATCNGMSSAQLAAAHPVSGGTYEYGHRFLHPSLGFAAGWLFLCAKSASAATAALGFAAYLQIALDVDGARTQIALGVAGVIALTAVVLSGMRRSNRINAVIVALTIAALAAFVVIGVPTTAAEFGDRIRPVFGDDGASGLLQATALMFVAYTGYGRIATLGEEVIEPRRTIPRAILTTLGVSALLYTAIAVVAVGAAGSDGFAAAAKSAAPLEIIARGLGHDAVATAIAIGAITAMLGVLLNLLLGLSRVLLAMGRRGDMPATVARVSDGTPRVAVLAVGALIAGLVLLGDVKTTWSLSAFTVLIYYSLTNAAALRLPKAQRLYPRWISVAGLLSCVFIAFWVEPIIWIAGLAILAAGFAWRFVWRRMARPSPPKRS